MVTRSLRLHVWFAIRLMVPQRGLLLWLLQHLQLRLRLQLCLMLHRQLLSWRLLLLASVRRGTHARPLVLAR